MEVTDDGTIVERGHRSQHQPWPLRVLKWLAIVVVALVALVALALVGLNTGPGKRLIVNQLNGFELASGLGFEVGAIRGSIYSDMTIVDLRVTDTRGVFLTSPSVRLDWHPFAFVNGHIDVDELSSDRVVLMRLPELKPDPNADPNAPLLPDYDIDVDRLAIGQLVLEAPVAGERRVASVDAAVAIANGRARVKANAGTVAVAGKPGGDRLALLLDARPDDDVFDLKAQLRAPADGVVANLAGLTEPLAAQITGKGTWSRWDGQLVARLGGDQLAGLRVRGRDGTFRVAGAVRPDLILSGQPAALTQPITRLDITAALDERRVDLNGTVSSAVFDLRANGLVDLGESRFENLKLAFLLKQPATVAPNLSGRDVRATLALDGAYATPIVDYRLRAAALGFNDTVVQGLEATGKARIDTDRILVPVSARARAITGLNATAGELLTNVSINGDLAVEGPRVLSDNLKIRSDRLNATAIVVADTSTGLYTGAINGSLNGYRVESVGIFNLNTDVDLRLSPGGYALVGRVQARSTRLLNDSLREQLGGNAVASARVYYGSDGIARFDQLTVRAPLLSVTGGSGRYLPSGQIEFDARGRSAVYGPVQVAVRGTLTNPEARLRLTSPGFGVGLAGLDATVRGVNGDYVITATGDTDYGAFSADLTVLTGRGPLTFDIRNARFAGIDFRGRVSQTGAGPYAGQLTAVGSGIDGTVRLAAVGSRQSADVRARVNNYSAPGTIPLTVGRALVDARVTLGDPLLAVGDVQFADVTYNTLDLAAGRAKFDVTGGRGRVQALVEGNSGVPFRVALNGDIAPELSRVALNGRANGIDFRTAAPARITREGAAYRLLPTRVDFSQGSARIAGLYGDGLRLQTRLDQLDLALLNSFSPGLGIGGWATGSLDFAQASDASFPSADTRLQIRDFTRTSLSARSKAVDVNLVGRLIPTGGDMAATIRRNGALIGRAKATLSPLSPGAGSWTTRLLEAPLGGGIRYNGPADVLFSLAALSGQTLTGPIGVAADFSGRVSAPQLNGLVRAKSLTYRNDTYGTRLSDMAIDGRFTSSSFQLNRLTARAGDGTVQAQGQVSLSADGGFPADIRAVFDNAQLAQGENISTRATGELRFTNTAAQGSTIAGTLRLPETRYKVVRSNAAEVPVLTGVRRASPAPQPDTRRRVTGDREPQPTGELFPIKLNIAVRADNELFVTGMGLESEWSTDMRVTGTATNPRVVGQVELIRGTYSFNSRRFELTKGLLQFTGSNPIEPNITLTASTDIEGVTVNLNVSGSAYKPQIAFTSSPSLPQDEIVSRILFGSSVTNLSAIQAVQLAASLNSLRGSGGGLDPLGKFQSIAGIDRLRILSPDGTSGRGTALAAGQYITKDIYIEIITDARGFTATQLDIALTRALSVISSFGSFGGSNVNVQYRKEY